MIENKIKKFAEQQKIPIRKLVLDIGMSETGYYAMLKNNSMKLETLRKISETLQIPLAYFFTEDGELVNLPAVGKEASLPADVGKEVEKYKKALARERKKNAELTTAVLNLSKH